MLVGIYKITNRLNNKVYIGKSSDLLNAWNEHKTLNNAKNLSVERDIALYGDDAFDFSILEECTPSTLGEREIFYIKLYDTANNGYNSKKIKHEFFSKPIKDGTVPKKLHPNVGIGLKKHIERMKNDSEYRAQMVQKYKNNRPNAISIDMLDKVSGELVLSFPKIMDGASWIRENTSYIKADYATINKVCKGQCKSAYGYKWRYTRDR